MSAALALPLPPAAGEDLDALLDAAFAATDRTDARQGLALAERVLATARSGSDVPRTARALSVIANAKRALADFAGAAEAAFAEHETLVAAGVAAGRAAARVDAALVFFDIGDCTRALALLAEARCALAPGDEARVAAQCAHAEGMVQSRLGEYAHALDSFAAALNLRREVGDDGAIAVTLNSMGVVHLRRAQGETTTTADRDADFAQALAWFGEARALAQRVGDDRLALLAQINVASVLGGQGRLQEALTRFLEQLPAARALADRYNESLLLANAGEACRCLGNAERARMLCEDALTVALAIASKVREQQARLQLSLACEACGDLAVALAQYKAYHALDRETRAAEAHRASEAQRLRAQIGRIEAEADRLRRLTRGLARENRVLGRQAREDALTGLANRRAFDDAADALLREPGRAAPAVVLFDIDRFKSINDRYTHAVGDAVLREVARLMVTHCRSSDVAARIGGEEFALLLPGADMAHARAVAERVRAGVSALDWSVIAPGLAVTLSAGVACGVSGQRAALVQVADAALYRAKRGGRDRVCAG